MHLSYPSAFPQQRRIISLAVIYYLTWSSGILNTGYLSEASNQALLLELDRALQMFTAQQQFLIEQVDDVAAYCCSVLVMIKSWKNNS